MLNPQNFKSSIFHKDLKHNIEDERISSNYESFSTYILFEYYYYQSFEALWTDRWWSRTKFPHLLFKIWDLLHIILVHFSSSLLYGAHHHQLNINYFSITILGCFWINNGYAMSLVLTESHSSPVSSGRPMFLECCVTHLHVLSHQRFVNSIFLSKHQKEKSHGCW